MVDDVACPAACGVYSVKGTAFIISKYNEKKLQFGFTNATNFVSVIRRIIVLTCTVITEELKKKTYVYRKISQIHYEEKINQQ